MPNLSFWQVCQNAASKTAYAIFHSRWMPGRSDINRVMKSSINERRAFYGLSLARREEVMLKHLQTQVAYCRQMVPYYRRMLKNYPQDFPRGWADFRAMPVLDKATIRREGDDLLSEAYTKDQLTRHATGGSTGKPLTVYLAFEEHGLGAAASEFFREQIGGEAGRRIAMLYGGDLDVSISPSLGRKIRNWFLNQVNIGCFRLDEHFLLQAHQAFESHQPDMLLGYASAIHLLASALKQKGLQPGYPRHTILTAAEKLQDTQREFIESVFTAQLVEQYGSRDIGLMAYQLPGDRRMQVNSWSHLIEPAEVPDEQGKAAILVSRLHTRAMPLLRYRIGDLAVFPADWEAGKPVHWLESIAGRELDWISLPGGRMVHGSEFPHLFKDYDVLLYQVRQDQDGDVTVGIMPGPEFDERQRKACEGIIRSNLAGVHTEFVYDPKLERTPQLKHRPVISDFKGEWQES